jgi:hypothetical protein
MVLCCDHTTSKRRRILAEQYRLHFVSRILRAVTRMARTYGGLCAALGWDLPSWRMRASVEHSALGRAHKETCGSTL